MAVDADRAEARAAPESGSGGAARRVPVALGARSYDIVIGPGLLAQAGERIAAAAPGAKCAIVTDETVAGHHLPALESSLAATGLHAGTIVLPPGEATKSFSELARLSEALLELAIERGDLVVAFGGGVIGDLAGFAASILRRGVRVVQIPTTLLAQVDSSVGGKTGINTPQGKNLIGTFHQPSLVLADLDVLKTLDPRQFRAGYAEIVKYGLIRDARFFDWLERHAGDIFALSPDALGEAVERSCKAKAEIVAMDERESGMRALLNLGHTFGHALEGWSGYSDRLLHGEAVAIGMCLAFELSVELGLCGADALERVRGHLTAVGLPTRIEDIAGEARPDAQRLLAYMAQDKKVAGGTLALVLARGIGEAFITRDVAADRLARFLAARLRHDS